MFSNLNMRLKIMLIIAVGILLMAVTGMFSTINMRNGIYALEDVLRVENQNQIMVKSANIEFKKQVQEWKNVLLRGHDSGQREKYWRQFQEQGAEVQTIIKQLIKNLDKYPEQRAVASQFLSNHTTMMTAYKKGLDAYVAAGFDHKVGDAAVKGIDRGPTDTLDKLALELEEIAVSITERVEGAAENTITQAYLSIFLVFVVVLGVALWLIQSSIIRPIYQMMTAVNRLTKGDTDFKIDVSTEDEMGMLMRSIDKLKSFLEDVVHELSDSATHFSGLSSQLSSLSGQISHNAHEQSERTDQVATASQELNHSAQGVSDHASEAANTTSSVNSLATSGQGIMTQAQKDLQNLSDEISVTTEVITSLAEKTKNVGSVLDVIRGIAEQTNLLALNAAIEAARAGEQGRGFAVVADEVRSLAQRTQESTTEIQSILESVQQGAANAVQAISQGRERSSEVTQKITEAATSLNNITQNIGTVSEMNLHISNSATEQTHVTSEITQLITQINDLSQQSVSSVQTADQMTSELGEIADRFDKILKRFKSAS